MKAMLLAVWCYRFFIISSIRTELRAKFARSRLGSLWIILNPLAQVFIFAFVLSTVLSARLPGINNQFAYAIYLMAGILCWSLFSEIITRCLTLFIENGNIIKKVAFPKIALPCIAVGNALINNVLLFFAIQLIFGLLGHGSSFAILWLPVLTITTVALALGLGLGMGVLNVFMRDIGQVVPVIMQFLFWLTPIVYMANIIPDQYRGWLALNPLIPIIVGYQDVLLYNRAPDLVKLCAVAVVAIVFLGLSLLIFRKASAEMVDQL